MCISVSAHMSVSAGVKERKTRERKGEGEIWNDGGNGDL